MNIAVFASGKGSNLQAVYTAAINGVLKDHSVSLVISNNSRSGAIQFAASKNITAAHLSMMQFGGNEKKFAEEILRVLDEAKTDIIVLAGYMKKLPGEVVEKYDKRIVNIHPALLPKHGGEGMYGLHVHEAVLACHENVTGATVHYVDKIYDGGEIIMQEECRVLPNDTPEVLQNRVKEIEHSLLPRAIALVIEKMSAE